MADAEAAARRASAHIQLALDAAGVGSFDWHITSGSLTWDERLCAMFGLDPTTFDERAETFFAAVLDADRDAVRTAVERAVGTLGDYRAEFRIRRPDGAVRWIKASGRVLPREDGTPERMLGVAQDSTELREARDRAARALEHMTDGFLSFDRQWRAVYVNQHAADLIGVAREEILGRTMWELSRALREGEREDTVRQALETGEPVSFNLFVVSVQRWYECRVLPGPHGVSMFLTDVTARRQEEVDGTAGPSRATQGRQVVDFSNALAEAVSVQDVCDVVRDRLLPIVSADGTVIWLADAGRLRIVGESGYDEPTTSALDGALIGLDAPVPQVMRERVPLYVPTLEDYCAAFPAMADVARMSGKQAWGFLPLVVSRRAVGCLTVSFSGPRELTSDERSLLVSLAGQLAQALERARLREAEQLLAAELQRSMLPLRLPEADGLTVSARYLPATAGLSIGGDWYDALHLPDGQIALVVGDVQGHSVLAAAQMGQLRHALRAYAAEGHDAATILQRTDRLMTELTADTFATCLLALVDLRTERLTVASAGHPVPLVRRSDGRVEAVEVPVGLPLGVDPEMGYIAATATVSPGDTLVLFTDGLVEHGRRDYTSGLAELEECLASLDPADVEAAASLLVGRADDSNRYDDVAILVARFDGLPEHRRPRHAWHDVDRASPSPVASARAFVASSLQRWEVQELADRVLLVTSELVTNAVQHGAGDVAVELTLTPGRLRLEVQDGSAAPPAPRPVDLMSTSGRGMHIVERLADSWGTAPRGDGKVVWADLDLASERRLHGPTAGLLH